MCNIAAFFLQTKGPGLTRPIGDSFEAHMCLRLCLQNFSQFFLVRNLIVDSVRTPKLRIAAHFLKTATAIGCVEPTPRKRIFANLANFLGTHPGEASSYPIGPCADFVENLGDRNDNHVQLLKRTIPLNKKPTFV